MTVGHLETRRETERAGAAGPSLDPGPRVKGAILWSCVLAATLAVGCGSPDDPDGGSPSSTSGDRRPEAALDYRVLARDTAFGGLGELVAMGPHLVVTDVFPPPAAHLVRRSDGKVLGSYGRAGEGPGEFERPAAVVRDAADSSRFWIFDSGLERLTPGVIMGADSVAWDRSAIVDLRADHTVDTAKPVNDSLIVGLGTFSEGRFGVFDMSGRQIDVRGEPPPGDEDIPASVRQHAYQSYLASHHGDTIVIANRHAARVEFYELDRPGVRLARTPASFSPRYGLVQGEEGPVFATGDSLRFGYIDVVTTDSVIYALYSGRTRGEADRANYGNRIHAFDWKGRLLATQKLAGEHIAIEIGPRGRNIYEPTPDPVPSVVTYDLSSVIDTERD